MLKDQLRVILALNNDWLRFAEAKNAGLLAFVSALSALLVRENDFHAGPVADRIGPLVALGALVAGSVACLLSFLPRLSIPWLDSTRAPKQGDNLLFYGHAACYEPSEYLSQLRESLNLREPEPDQLDHQYAVQIVMNARIALRKYRLFALACWLTIAGIVVQGVVAAFRSIL